MNKLDLNVLTSSQHVQDYKRINDLLAKLPNGSTPVTGFQIRTELEESELVDLLSDYEDYYTNPTEINRLNTVSILSRYHTTSGTNNYTVSQFSDIILEARDIIRINFGNANTSTTVSIRINNMNYNLYNQDNENYSAGDLESNSFHTYYLNDTKNRFIEI